MQLLAIESATRQLGVALLRDAAPCAERALREQDARAEGLLALVDQVLQEARTPLSAVDAFAVSIGPGSFSGLRVGVATVKGLAFGGARPVVAVSSLAALASEAPSADGPIVAVLDAQRGELYAGAFAPADLAPLPDLPEDVYTHVALAERLPPGALLVGEEGLIRQGALRDCRRMAVPAPRAGQVGRLGWAALARGESTAVERLTPRYLRRAAAERSFQRRFDTDRGLV